MTLDKLDKRAAQAEGYAKSRAGQKDEGVGKRPRVAPAQNVSTSNGQSLPGGLRSRFEGSLGRDLGNVRVHTDPAANEAAEQHGARAFATGDNIFFGAGQYNAESTEGQRLIGHEVAHTAQQTDAGGGVQTKRTVSEPGDASEVEADRAADAMVAGEPTSVSTAPSAAIQRDPKDKGGEKKDDGKLEMEKPPKWTATSRTFKAFGQEATLSWADGMKATLPLGSAKIPIGKPIAHKNPIPLGPMGGIWLEASGSAAVEAKGSAFVSAKAHEWPGPWDCDPTGLVFEAGGDASVGFNVSATIKFGGYVGATFANVNAVGALTLSADATAKVGIAGGGSVNPAGDVMGFMALTVSNVFAVTATGSIAVQYEALIDSGTLFSHELFKTDLAKATVAVVAGQDMSSGVLMQPEPVASFEWAKWPESQPTPMVPLSAKDKEQLKAAQSGGSGAGAQPIDEELDERREPLDCTDPGAAGGGGYYSDCPPEHVPQESDGSGGADAGEDPHTGEPLPSTGGGGGPTNGAGGAGA